VIDFIQEAPLLALAQVPALLPPGPGGRPMATSTIWRWTRSGVPGPDGERVFLETARVGGRVYTSRRALQRFMDRLTPGVDHD
jgi:hypothetical protein